MIIRTRSGANSEIRAAVEFGTSAIPPPWARGMQGWASAVGRRVTTDDMMGIPAAARCIRIKAETIASMGLEFFRPDAALGILRKVEPSPDEWQAQLFETGPALDWTAYDWISDMVGGVEGYGNAFALKTLGTGPRGRRQVLELLPLDPDYVRVRNQHGAKVFDVRIDNATRTYTPDDILHFRGFTVNGKFSGFSPALIHAQAIGYAMALEEFAGRYFRNDTSVGVVLQVPGNLSVRGAQRMLATFEMSKSGAPHAHRPAIVYNGTKVERLGLGLKDSQHVEAQQWTVQQCARIWGVPLELLEVGGAEAGAQRLTTEQVSLRFLQFGLFSALRRFEDVLTADPQLGLATVGIKPKFNLRSILRVDAQTAAMVEHLEIQDGTLLRDEARAGRGLPPLPPIPDDPTQEPGKVPLLTPVGAGANPLPDAGASASPSGG